MDSSAAKEIGQVDMVIIDEASMVLLPMMWFAASRATERIVVCGDFGQIPPIVTTREKAIFDVLGDDIFRTNGLNKLRADDTRMVMLQTQRRMHPAICNLISGPMYRGRLDTETSDCADVLPFPFESTLTIIDTSDLWPFESVNPFFSRFNLMHAVLVRNLAWYLHQKGCIEYQTDFGICTPYAAQAKLIRKLIENEADLSDIVQVGTVHNFQGDERRAIILELPESYGGRMVGQFLQGEPPDHVGARLINVAVSRAKSHFLVLANLTHLDRLLPRSALLRGILYEMQQKGRVICGTELLAMRPLENDLRGIIGHLDLDLDAKTLGLFDGPGFERALEIDITNAKDSVVLFSGFVTPTKVGKIGDLLRLKIAQGVKVRCVTRPPHLNGTLDPNLGEQALDMLSGIGCIVDGRSRIHEKIVLVDREIVWHGSLNILSHNYRTDESMTRIVNAGFAEAIAANMAKRPVSSAAALQAIASPENPPCGDCGARTYYDEGKFGSYFCCEKKCGWSSSLKDLRRDAGSDSQRSRELPTNGPPCPTCGSPTRLRDGKFGPFYGCQRYPTCSGKCKLPSKTTKGQQKHGNSRPASKKRV